MVLLITFLAGLSILVGAAVTHISKDPAKIEHISIALALGALLGLLLFDLRPDIGEFVGSSGWPVAVMMIAIGLAVLKILDMFVPDHEDTEANHDKENALHIGVISSLAIILHNIVEGMTVYSLALASLQGGIVFAVGIAMHNIPMGMMIYTTLEGERKRAKLALLSSVTLSTLVGGILMSLISEHLTETVIGALVCVAGGMILYIVFAELIPHVIKTRQPLQSTVMAVCGFVLVYLSCMPE